jgi:hypothetical protein
MDFRQYDNTLGRFNVIDPLAEKDYGITPYHFGYDNPVLFGDPIGLKAMAPETMENNIVPGSLLAMFASGMNGLQVRDALEQQAWGPNFMIIHAGGGGGSSGGNGVGGVRYDGAGGVHLLTTNYKTGESGYWERRYIGNADIPESGQEHINAHGIIELQEVTIMPMYEKTWFPVPQIFFGCPIRIIPDIGAGSYFAGAINISNKIWQRYLKNGLNSFEGRFLMHEYGHYLQNKNGGSFWYIYPAISSIIDAGITNNGNIPGHSQHWAEIQASTLAYYFFGFPSGFIEDNNPINVNYVSPVILNGLYNQYTQYK